MLDDEKSKKVCVKPEIEVTVKGTKLCTLVDNCC